MRYSEYMHYSAQGQVDWMVLNPAHPDPLVNTPLMPDETPPTFDPARPDSNIVTFYGHDSLGRVTLITQTGILTGEINPTTDFFTQATQRVTKIEYDGLNRPVTRTLNYVPGAPINAAPDVNVQTYTYYDGVGNVIWQSDALGRWMHTAYDSFGRPVTVTLNYENGDPTTVDAANTTWTDGHDTDILYVTRYSARGEVEQVIENYHDGIPDLSATEPITDRIQLMAHDDLGRVISSTTNYAPQSPDIHANITTEVRFDPQTGQLKAEQMVDGSWNVPHYDDLGRVTHTIMNCRDALGNPS